ncbi:MAG: hypothetical protein KDA84_17200, partial [Planctomycetaceae bacterium]|nr:hypothetical protein [Planctomycetaceae bacterium]
MTGTNTRVVITGIGLVTGLGSDRESTWRALLSGAGAVRRLDPSELCRRAGLTHLPGAPQTYLGAPVAGVMDCSAGTVFEQEPNIRLANLAAEEALQDAQVDWDTIKPPLRGCVIGTSKGGMHSISRLLAAEHHRDNSDLPPELWPMFWPSTPASIVAERWKIRGPVLCPVAACATGLMSLWRGAELIREGTCDVVLAGSTDASLHPSVLGAFSRMGVLAKETDDPREACRPFDLNRSGFVVGEGAAVLVMERADVA